MKDWILKPIKSIRNDDGVILITVIMLTIVLSIVAISIMTINLSQVNSSQTVVDNIKSEQIALGVFYQYHQAKQDNCASCPSPGDCLSCLPNSVTLDGKTYQILYCQDCATPGDCNTCPLVGASSVRPFDVQVRY